MEVNEKIKALSLLFKVCETTHCTKSCRMRRIFYETLGLRSIVLNDRTHYSNHHQVVSQLRTNSNAFHCRQKHELKHAWNYNAKTFPKYAGSKLN